MLDVIYDLFVVWQILNIQHFNSQRKILPNIADQVTSEFSQEIITATIANLVPGGVNFEEWFTIYHDETSFEQLPTEMRRVQGLEN